MARKLRLQYPGGIYHVLNHGDRRKAIFCDEEESPIKLIHFGLRYSDFLSPRSRAVAAGRISWLGIGFASPVHFVAFCKS